VNHVHQPANSPYRAAHAVYILEEPGPRFDRIGEVPDVLRPRVISLRAFDAAGMIVDAALCAGTEVEQGIEHLLTDARVDYLQLHYAKFGCFACRVDRVDA